LSEVKPLFGNKAVEELKSYYRNGVYPYGPIFTDLWSVLERLVQQTRTSTKTPLLSILLEGPTATGKTAIAAKLCSESAFPFIRMISADNMIGHGENQKCQALLRVSIYIMIYKSMYILYI
jgi:vesicle-fusing ATPase